MYPFCQGRKTLLSLYMGKAQALPYREWTKLKTWQPGQSCKALAMLALIHPLLPNPIFFIFGSILKPVFKTQPLQQNKHLGVPVATREYPMSGSLCPIDRYEPSQPHSHQTQRPAGLELIAGQDGTWWPRWILWDTNAAINLLILGDYDRYDYNVYNFIQCLEWSNFQILQVVKLFFAPCPAAPPRHSHDDSDLLVMVKVPKSPSDDSSTQVPEAKVFSPTGNIQNTDIPYWEKKNIYPLPFGTFSSRWFCGKLAVLVGYGTRSLEGI